LTPVLRVTRSILASRKTLMLAAALIASTNVSVAALASNCFSVHRNLKTCLGYPMRVF
jgi:hypothetical protein